VNREHDIDSNLAAPGLDASAWCARPSTRLATAPRGRPVPVSKATDSSGYEQVIQRWRALAVFKMVRDDAQRQSLSFRQRLVSSGLVGECARKLDDLSEPVAVVLLLDLHSQRLFGRAPSLGTRPNRHERPRTRGGRVPGTAADKPARWSDCRDVQSSVTSDPARCQRPGRRAAGPYPLSAAKPHAARRPLRSCSQPCHAA
jgi:hypothetical protein